MRAIAKATLKGILPSSAYAWASRKHQHAKLVVRRREAIEATNLSAHSLAELKAIFLAPDVAAPWERDHQEIRSVYGDVDLFAGVNPGDRRALYYLVHALEPRHVLETGTHVSASTIHMAMAMKAIGRGSVTTVDIIDVNDGRSAAWHTVGLAASPRHLARRLGCDDRIEFVTSPAQDYMRGTDQRFDLVFLDGDHTPAGVYAELALALRLLAPQGMVLLHDYQASVKTIAPGDDIIEGPFLAARRIARENRDIVFHPIDSLPWPTKAGSHLTTLAIVARRS